MSENWFYRVFGEEFGPVSLSDLRDFATNGTLSGDDEVRPEALTMWIPANAVRELQDLYQELVESVSTVTSTMNAAAESPTATDEWYYRFSDTPETEVGPLPFDAIIELAKFGRLMADDEVRLGIDNKWRRAGSMGRLVAVLPYQTRRCNPAPVLTEGTPEETSPTSDAVQDLLDSLPDAVVEEPQTERKTPRAKQRDTADTQVADATDRKTSTPKSKTRRVDLKRANKAAATAPVETEVELSPSALQEIEDQILEELMTPCPKEATAKAEVRLSATSPANPLPMASIPQDSWSTTPHITSPSNASFSRPTPPTPSPRPRVKPFKPARSGPSLAELVSDPKTLKGIAILVPLLLIVGWLRMPESNAADVKAYQELDSLFTQLREVRKNDTDGKKVIPVGQKLNATAKEIATTMKKTADADHPARQALLWASLAVPKITKDGLGGESPSEKEALLNLNRAAIALGLKDSEPAMVANNTDNNEP